MAVIELLSTHIPCSRLLSLHYLARCADSGLSENWC
jgi:hypothetical protein